MAVHHATRQRQGPLGFGAALASRSAAADLATASGALDAELLPRRRTRAVVRSGRRSEGRVGLVLGGIAVAFLLAFFSLAQTVRVSATGYDIDRLRVERQRLEARRQELLNDLTRLGREPAIRKGAMGVGLAPLVDPLVIPAR